MEIKGAVHRPRGRTMFNAPFSQPKAWVKY
jgi:hypothetical protein